LPAKPLVYLGWHGAERVADELNKTALHKIVAETTIDEFCLHVLNQLLAQMPDRPPAELTVLLRHAWRQGAYAVFDLLPPSDPYLQVVLRGGGSEQVLAAFKRLVRSMAQKAEVRQLRLHDRRVQVIEHMGSPTRFAWWIEGEDLVFALWDKKSPGEALAGAFKAVESGKGIRSGAIYAKLREISPRPILEFAIDLDRAWSLLQQNKVLSQARLKELGLDGLKAFVLGLSCEGKAFRTDYLLWAPAPRRAAVADLLEREPVSFEQLPPIPADATSVSVGSLDVPRFYRALRTLLIPIISTALEQPGEEAWQHAEDGFQQLFGVKVGQVLNAFGSRWATYTPRPVGFAGQVVVWELKEPAVWAKLGAKAVELIERQPRLPVQLQVSELEGGKLWRLQFKQQMPLPIAPAVGLTDRWLAFSVSAPQVSEFIKVSAGKLPRWQPPAGFKRERGDIPMTGQSVGWSDPRPMVQSAMALLPLVLQSLQGQVPGMRFDLALCPKPDEITRHLFPSHWAEWLTAEGVRGRSRDALPFAGISSGQGSLMIAAVGTALLLPAVQQAREAARRTQCRNNLMMIMLALHNYHDTYGHFPPAVIHPPGGKPPYSWRVALLPFLEEEELYKQYNFNEPWDGPNNRKLLERMPECFRCPSSRMPKHCTSYAVITGPSTLFQGKEGVRIAEVTDGLSGTLAVVETERQIPWTKPEDLKYDPAGPLPPIGSAHPGGYNAAFADGTVRFISRNIDEKLLRALITISGGETVPLR